MKSNGYGRFIQKIVINVALADVDAVSQKLGISAEPDTANSAKLIWTHLTRQLGNDEDVVFDLWMELGDLAYTTKWQIDWEASEY